MTYYIPVVDNLLDTIITLISFLAGTILTTSFLKIDSIELRWTLGILVGGVASIIQAGTGLLRMASTKFTGGFGNAFIANCEKLIEVNFSLLHLWLLFLWLFWSFTFCISAKKGFKTH
jgi:hypothetical protein